VTFVRTRIKGVISMQVCILLLKIVFVNNYFLFHVCIMNYYLCVSYSAGSLGRLPVVKTSLEDDGELLKNEFKKFLGGLFASISERREQEELGILNSR